MSKGFWCNSRGYVSDKQLEKQFYLSSDSMIISNKEARKLIGKEVSDKLTDSDLMRVIGDMYNLADRLLGGGYSSNNQKGMVE